MSSLCDALPLQLRPQPQPQPVKKRKGKESGRVIVACVWRTEANFDFSSETDFIFRRDDDAVAVKNINWVRMSRSIILRLAPYFASRIRQNHRLLSSSSSSAASSSPYPSSLDDADSDAIHMTQNCVQRMKELQSNETSKSLRLTVETGGCSGFQYVFLLDDKTNPDDRIFENEGVKLVVDNISYDFVKGATVDYVEELIRAAFVVTENPSAVGGCSCKSSFMVRQ